MAHPTPPKPEDCPTPEYHLTHKYCPSCTWTYEAPEESKTSDCMLVKVLIPRALSEGPGQEMEQREAVGWLTGFEVFGPAPRATCEAAAAKINKETHAFTVTEVRSLDELTNDSTEGA